MNVCMFNDRIHGFTEGGMYACMFNKRMHDQWIYACLMSVCMFNECMQV